MVEHHYFLTAGQIFTLFFVMIGPLRLMSPFFQATRTLSFSDLKKLVTTVTLISTSCLVVSGFAGSRLLAKWHIDPPVMLLAGGIVFFMAGIKPLITQESTHSDGTLLPTPSSIALGLELTPYGIATIIVLMSTSRDIDRTMTILLCLLAIMLLNALSMLFGRHILNFVGQLPMKIIGTALGVLQLGLATQIIIKSLMQIKG